MTLINKPCSSFKVKIKEIMATDEHGKMLSVNLFTSVGSMDSVAKINTRAVRGKDND